MGVVHAEQAALVGATAIVVVGQRVPVRQLGSVAVDERTRITTGRPDLQVRSVEVDPAAFPFAVGGLGPRWGIGKVDQTGQRAAVCLESSCSSTLPAATEGEVVAQRRGDAVARRSVIAAADQRADRPRSTR